MAASGGSGVKRLLVCRAGAKVCGFPLERVLETMRPLPVEPFAQMPEFVLGVAVIRGRATAVIDARQLLGSPSDRPPERYVTLGFDAHAERSAAFALDSVLGVREVDASALGAWPRLLGDARGDVVQRLGALDSELFLVLEHARLLPEAAWRLLEQEPRSA